MLIRFDPFRAVERPWAPRSPFMPLDVYRRGDEFVVRVDLPGVDPASIDVTVDHNVLTIKAERSWVAADGDNVITAERARGTFTRRLALGNAVNVSAIAAGYENGVLTLTVPVAEKAKARKVEITVGGQTGAPGVEDGEGNEADRAA
jgi:HSP20 family protein